MKTFILLILLFHLDPDGNPYTATMQESPVNHYNSLQECETAAEQKRAAMLLSAQRYPDLMIVDVKIRCVDSSEADFDPSFIHI